MGKGSRQRAGKGYAENYDKIFRKPRLCGKCWLKYDDPECKCKKRVKK